MTSKKAVLAVILLAALPAVTALEINDSESLRYSSGSDIDFRVGTDGQLHIKNTVNTGGNAIKYIGESTTIEADGDINMNSGGDILNVNTVNAKSITSNQANTPVDMDAGIDLDGNTIIDDDDNEVHINDDAVITGYATLDQGTNVNEFSTDEDLTDNSDDAVPTEQAVKQYAAEEVRQDACNGSYVYLDGSGACTDFTINNDTFFHGDLIKSDTVDSGEIDVNTLEGSADGLGSNADSLSVKTGNAVEITSDQVAVKANSIGNSEIKNNQNFDIGTLDVSGGAAGDGSQSGLTVDSSGNVYFSGSLNFPGDVNVVNQQQIDGSFIPDQDAQFNLGKSSKKWKNAYLSGDLVMGSTTLTENDLDALNDGVIDDSEALNSLTIGTSGLVQAEAIDQESASTGEVLEWDGSNWQPATDNSASTDCSGAWTFMAGDGGCVDFSVGSPNFLNGDRINADSVTDAEVDADSMSGSGLGGTNDAIDVNTGNAVTINGDSVAVASGSIGNNEIDNSDSFTFNGATLNSDLDMSDNHVNNVKEIELQDWDSDSGGTDNSVRLLRRDDNWMFYDGGVAVGDWGDGALGDLSSGQLVTDGNLHVTGGNLYDSTGTNNFFEVGCNDGDTISNLGSTGSSNCQDISHDSIADVSYNDHHGLGDDLSWDGSNNPRLTNGEIDVDEVAVNSNSDYGKLSVHGGADNSYKIGMHNNMGYGDLNDWAMTFTMNDDNNRGFVWRDENMGTGGGAMSLTTDGDLTVAGSLDVSGALVSGSSSLGSGSDSTSVALGDSTTASGGSGATALGRSTIASGGSGATALGHITVASGGSGATALGRNIDVSGTSSVGIGLDATTYTVSGDNTMAVMGGPVGIGTTSPSSKLDVAGSAVLNSGTSVSEFSTDEDLTDNSDDALPTEQAVKQYVDGQPDNTGTDDQNLQATTRSGNTVTVPIENGASTSFTDQDNQGLPDVLSNQNTANDGQRIEIDELRARDGDGLSLTRSSGGNGLFLDDNGEVGIGTASPAQKLDVSGAARLRSGTNINEFSTDEDLTGNSDNALPTEQAVKQYVNANDATGTDDQNLQATSRSGNTVTVPIENGASTSFTDNYAADNQDLGVSNDPTGGSTTITIDNGNSATFTDDYEADTDNQGLTYSNDNSPTGNYVTHSVNIDSGSNIDIRDYYTSGNTQDLFETVDASGTNLVADNPTDTVSINAGSGISISASSGSDSLTITNTGDTTSDTIADDGTIQDSEVNNDLTISTSGSVQAEAINQEGASTGDVLEWDGSNWQPGSVSGGSASPGGSDADLQYNDGGSFRGASQLNWDDNNHRLGIGTSSPSDALEVSGSVLLNSGTDVNEFSTDTGLSDSSDNAVPTEDAVKTYVDNNAGGGGDGYIGDSTSHTAGGNVDMNGNDITNPSSFELPVGTDCYNSAC